MCGPQLPAQGPHIPGGAAGSTEMRVTEPLEEKHFRKEPSFLLFIDLILPEDIFSH